VLLTTTLEDVPIGSSFKLPEFIKNSKSIVSFESVPNNMCLWYCLAHHRHPELRLDRLATKAKDLYKDYYKITVNKNYPGMDIQELDKIENYFGHYWFRSFLTTKCSFNFLEQQEVYQMHNKKSKQPSYSPIMVYSVNDQW
jgi:hypothetical protein